MDIKEIALKVGLQVFEEHPYDKGHVVSPSDYTWIDDKLIEFAEALIESYKAELLKEVGEPVYQVCKSDSISLSSAWVDVTEQTMREYQELAANRLEEIAKYRDAPVVAWCHYDYAENTADYLQYFKDTYATIPLIVKPGEEK